MTTPFDVHMLEKSHVWRQGVLTSGALQGTDGDVLVAYKKHKQSMA
jgi:hypothetical protein